LAIDPLTAKLLAQAAARAATDEESRRRTLILILAPILGLLLLIAFILYLITSPFSMLSQWLVGDEVSVVENFQKEYGYSVDPVESKALVYAQVRKNFPEAAPETLDAVLGWTQ